MGREGGGAGPLITAGAGPAASLSEWLWRCPRVAVSPCVLASVSLLWRTWGFSFPGLLSLGVFPQPGGGFILDSFMPLVLVPALILWG